MSCVFDKLADNPNNIVLVNPKRSELEEILRSRPNETCMFLGHGSGNGLFRADNDYEGMPKRNNSYSNRTYRNLDCTADDEPMDYDDYYESLYGDGCDDDGQYELGFDDDYYPFIDDDYYYDDEHLYCGNNWGDWTPYIIDANNVELLYDREVIGIWCYASEFAVKHHLRGFFTYMFVSNPMEASCLNFRGHTTEEVDEQNIHFCEQINNFINEGVEPIDFIEKLEYDDDIDFVHFNYSNMIYNYGY
jgi:hypothetical protein